MIQALSGLRRATRRPVSRVLDVALPVPDQPADIELVVQQAGAAQRVAADGGIAPRPAAGAGHALGVQPAGDRARRAAGGVLAEDPPHDLGFAVVDHRDRRGSGCPPASRSRATL